MFQSSDEEEDGGDDEGAAAPPAGYVDPEDEIEMPAHMADAPPAGAAPAAPPPATAAGGGGPESGSAPSILDYWRAANPHAMDTSIRDILLGEGYLTMMKNQKKKGKEYHFRLTENHLSFYAANASSLISKVNKTDIIHIEDVAASKQFVIKTAVPWGLPEDQVTELLVQAKDETAKAKWMKAFGTDLNNPPRGYERIICESYLVKVQPMCTVSTTRWFVATNNSFSYYKSEGGNLYAKVKWEHIQYVTETSNKKEFKLQASVPMTKTGFYDATCRAKTKEERDKWVAMLQRILPQQKMSTELQMCCFMEE